MKCIEKVARTIDTAITDALIELGATTDQVNIEIIQKGSKGIFGIGAKNAKVKVTLKEIEEDTLETITDIVEETVLNKEVIKESPQPTKKIAKAEIDTEAASKLAIDFLTNVLKAINIEATINTKVVGDKLDIDISGDKMGIIIGKRGETLDSLQYLTNIVVNKGNEGYIKVMIDTENYRSRREDTLKKLAYKLAKKASQTKKPVILEPMNPYDRRIIHSALQDSRTVKTHSEGKEPFRRVVITPSAGKSYK
ncbi:MAG: RNA-binding cell elongation regulator Jag/EloR [Cellulosilyticaceae bacterium]